MEFLILFAVLFIIFVIALFVMYCVSKTQAEEAELGIFWNGDMHLPIEGNEEEYIATRGLY